jgi:N utilization substance protein A
MSKEILSVIESVSHEKGVPKDVIFGAMEAALAMATKKKYGEEAEFRVAIDRETGEYETFRTWAVVDFDDLDEEEEPNPGAQYSVEEARQIKADAELGDVLEDQVESVEFGRIAAQTAKQVIVQKVREAERAQIVEMYQSRMNELISGTVKKLGRDSIIIDLGNNAEAILTREHLIPREVFRIGDRLRAMLVEIRPDNRGPQLILSRTAPAMLVELFKVEVPEIA